MGRCSGTSFEQSMYTIKIIVRKYPVWLMIEVKDGKTGDHTLGPKQASALVCPRLGVAPNTGMALRFFENRNQKFIKVAITASIPFDFSAPLRPSSSHARCIIREAANDANSSQQFGNNDYSLPAPFRGPCFLGSSTMNRKTII